MPFELDHGTLVFSPSKQGDTFYLSFMFSPSEPVVLDKITFYPLYRAKDPSFNPTSFKWDFGDGSTSTEKNPTHQYIAPGEYLIVLTASSSFATNVYSKYIYIKNKEQENPLAPPVALFTTNHIYSFVNQEIDFYNSSHGVHQLTYEWDFGDGSTSTDINPTHSYSKIGSYTICLTATDTVNNLSSKYCIVIPIIEIPDEYDFLIEVTTDVSSNMPKTISPLEFILDVSTSLSNIVKLQSSFDFILEVENHLNFILPSDIEFVLDTFTSLLFRIEHLSNFNYILNTYTDMSALSFIEGAFSFTIDTKNEINFTHQIVHPEDWHLPPSIQILQSDYTEFVPFSITFSALTSGEVISINWYINNKKVSDKKSFTYTFNESDIFTIKCVASNAYGTSIASSQVFALMPFGKYFLKTDLFYYYYLLDRVGNFIYIFDMNTNEEVKKFGGTGTDMGKFLKLMSMDISKPQKFIGLKNQNLFWR